MGARRKGPGKRFTLEHIRDQTQKLHRPFLRDGDAPTAVVEWPWVHWRVLSHYRHLFRPHSIITCTSIVYMASTDRGLTRDELNAIVSIIIFRPNHKPFKKLQFHPILACTYFGGPMGRIIQATYDGKELTLQYSLPWRFGRDAPALMELFMRYLLSEPVDGVCALPIR
ncbi:unnamed protein product [Penicillium salamii]|nr:unnamed protein product [Penicillium salamii]